MPLDEDRLQFLIQQKDTLGGSKGGEGWAIVDGALVIHDFENPPSWFPKDRDEDGNTPDFDQAA